MFSVGAFDIVEQAAFDASAGTLKGPGQALMEKHGGRVLAMGAVTISRGEWPSGRAAVVEWPDEESFNRYREATSSGGGRPGVAMRGEVIITQR